MVDPTELPQTERELADGAGEIDARPTDALRPNRAPISPFAGLLARLRRSWATPVNVALAAIVVVFVALGLVHTIGLPGFAPLDEPRHVGYAVELAKGHLPTVHDHLPFLKLGTVPVRGSKLISAANHPPLYYALIAIPIKLFGDAHLDRAIVVARVMTLLIAAAGLVMAFRALRRLTPDRPGVALLAVAIAAALPAFVNCSAIVMNDSLAFLAAAALYDAAFAILTTGPSRRAAIAFGAWLTVSALTRFTSILVFPPAFLAVVLGYVLHDPRKVVVRLLRGSAVCAASLMSATLASGAFYYRNYELYGDVTGGKALFAELKRTPRSPFLTQLGNGHLWLNLIDQLFERLSAGIALTGLSMPGRMLFALGALGLFKCAYDARALLAPRAAPWKNPRLLGGLLAVMGLLFVTLPIFEFYSRGGGLSPRYYFPMLWGLTFLLALGLSSTKSAIAPTSAAIGVTIYGALITEIYFGRLPGARTTSLAVLDAFTRAEVPWPEIAVSVLVAILSVGLALIATRLPQLLGPPRVTPAAPAE